MAYVDLTEVPGLSAAAAGALGAAGAFTTADLLRLRRADLAAATGLALGSLRRWQGFAELSEIEGLSAEAVAALVEAGVDGVDEFCGRRLGALRAALQGLASPPSDDEIVAALLAARRLQLTGVIHGRVVAAGEVPLEGATVVAGGETARTDARGRFRIAGLRLGRGLAVTIDHPAKRGRTFLGVVAQPATALADRRFRLTGRPSPARRLSAMAGDALPPLGSAPLTTEARDEPPLPRDRFILLEFYRNGDGKLGSLFLDFAEGRFVMRTYRVAKADLPAGALPKDRMRLDGGRLVRARLGAARLARLVRLRAAARRYEGKPLTAEMMPEVMRRLVAALNER
jgi:hypothetical protein